MLAPKIAATRTVSKKEAAAGGDLRSSRISPAGLHALGNQATRRLLARSGTGAGPASSQLSSAGLVIGAANSAVERSARAAERGEPAAPAAEQSAAGEALTAAPPSVRATLAEPGHPLDPVTRSGFERQFARDLSGVRVHTSDRAASSARDIHARAYTLGHDVVFARGRFAPSNPAGRGLLAHELAHVAEQDNGPAVIRRSPDSGVDCSLYGTTPDDPVCRLRQDDDTDDPSSPLTSPLPVTTSPLSPDPRAFTDEQIYGPLQETDLIDEAVRQGEKQARRRMFFDSVEDMSDPRIKLMIVADADFRADMESLDIYWNDAEQGLQVKPEIEQQEHDLDHRYPDADRIYREAYANAMYHQPEPQKSWFGKTMGFLCEHTEPCASNMEQYHADLDSGMSVEEARKRGMFRLGVTTAAASMGGEGPGDLVEVGPGRSGPGLPFEVPATETTAQTVPHEPTPEAPLESRPTPPERTAPATVEQLRPREPASEPAPEEPAGKQGKEKPRDNPATSRRALRKQLRERLKERIEQKQADIDSLISAKARGQRVLKQIDAELRSIRTRLKGGDEPALRARQAKLESMRYQIKTYQSESLGSEKDLWEEKAEAKRLLNATEAEYYDALTSAAARKRTAMAAESGAGTQAPRDEVFGTSGKPLEVDHVHPRSKVFETPGFEKLSWEQQIEIFNYKPNLKTIPAEANAARGNMSYSDFGRTSSSPYAQNQAAIREMSALETKMKTDIDNMIKNPNLIPKPTTAR
jgi:hypothetical protein